VDNGLLVSESNGDDPTELCQVQDPLDAKGKVVILKKRAVSNVKRKEKLLNALLKGVFCREDEDK
jgi:hypothetical protein